MSWVESYQTNAAGQLKAFLDNIITNYGKEGNYGWEIYDSNAGTNIGVYRCKPDDNSSFILVVKDNQADYATIEYWDGWDTDNHVGIGNRMTYGNNSNYTLRIRKVTGVWGSAISKSRIVIAFKASGFAYYLGYPRRYDETKDTPLFIGHDANTSGSGYSINPLGGAYNVGFSSTIGITWRFFRDVNGNINKQAVSLSSTPINSVDSLPKRDNKTTTGRFVVFEDTVQQWDSPYSLIGVLDGVMCLSKSSIVENGDTIVVEDDTWLVVRATLTCLVRMA